MCSSDLYPSWQTAGFIARNLLLFSWPVWPIAAFAWLSWRGMRRAAHVTLPLAILGMLFLLLVLQRGPGDVQFILLLPPMAILAAFALPTLPRAAINAVDWFALLFFTIFGLIGGWVGRRTGSPLAAGIGLGLLLAWAIGVSFPLYAPG